MRSHIWQRRKHSTPILLLTSPDTWQATAVSLCPRLYSYNHLSVQEKATRSETIISLSSSTYIIRIYHPHENNKLYIYILFAIFWNSETTEKKRWNNATCLCHVRGAAGYWELFRKHFALPARSQTAHPWFHLPSSSPVSRLREIVQPTNSVCSSLVLTLTADWFSLFLFGLPLTVCWDNFVPECTTCTFFSSVIS